MLGAVPKSTIQILWRCSTSVSRTAVGLDLWTPEHADRMVASRREHRRTYCRRSKWVGKFRGSSTMGCCGGSPARRGGLGSPRLDVADGDGGPVCAATRGAFERPPATGVRCTAHRCHQPRLRLQIRRTRDRCTAHTGGRSSRRRVAPVCRWRGSTRPGPQTTT
jgi:hypothetical protein